MGKFGQSAMIEISVWAVLLPKDITQPYRRFMIDFSQIHQSLVKKFFSRKWLKKLQFFEKKAFLTKKIDFEKKIFLTKFSRTDLFFRAKTYLSRIYALWSISAKSIKVWWKHFFPENVLKSFNSSKKRVFWPKKSILGKKFFWKNFLEQTCSFVKRLISAVYTHTVNFSPIA